MPTEPKHRHEGSEPERYQVVIQRDPEKVLRKLPKNLLLRIRTAIHALATDPNPQGSKRLVGLDDLYRVRVGDWHIIYAIYEEQLIVLVIEVAPRGGAYRNL
jgi:mRNA interferase RelE/StbE